MAPTLIVAIDPGASGGIAVWNALDPSPSVFKMPETEGDILELLKMAAGTAPKTGAGIVAVIEEVSGYAGNGQPGSAMFKFGRNFGFLIGAVMALGFRVELVRPQKWIKALGMGTRDQSQPKTVWKNKLKSEAQRLYPDFRVTLKTSDALLLLEYYKKMHP